MNSNILEKNKITILGKRTQEFDEILTPDALDFLKEIQEKFGNRREELLKKNKLYREQPEIKEKRRQYREQYVLDNKEKIKKLVLEIATI